MNQWTDPEFDRLSAPQEGDHLDEDRLPCGCLGECGPYAHDTAWDWDDALTEINSGINDLDLNPS
jgi:hypothetical protein